MNSIKVPIESDVIIRAYVELNTIELFKHLVHGLRCDCLLKDDFCENFKVRQGDDGELHLYRMHGDQASYYDDRGELYLTLVKLGNEICPNWENRGFKEESETSK